MHYHVNSILLILLHFTSLRFTSVCLYYWYPLFITYPKTSLIAVFITLHLVGYKTVNLLYLNWVNPWVTDNYLFLLSEHHSRSQSCPGGKEQDNRSTISRGIINDAIDQCRMRLQAPRDVTLNTLYTKPIFSEPHTIYRGKHATTTSAYQQKILLTLRVQHGHCSNIKKEPQIYRSFPSPSLRPLFPWV